MRVIGDLHCNPESITVTAMNNETPNTSHNLGRTMVWIAWLLVLGLLTLFFNNVLDKQRNPNQQLGAVDTGAAIEVTLQRNHYGHYVATGAINDQPVEFMVDTGATTVSIPADLAQQLGLQRGAAMSTSTANGVITTYATVLPVVSLGAIRVHDVRAHINPYGEDVLLGMSFLKNLEFTQRGDTLILRQYQ